MFKFFSALLIGVLSASLAVIYQNDIAAFLGRAPVTAEATPGAWYPHFQDLQSKEKFTSFDTEAAKKFGSPEDTNFARFVIHNNTGREIPNAYIKLSKEDWASYDAVVIAKKDGAVERTLIKDAKNRIAVGGLPAADDMTVYVWSTQTFGYPFGFDDVSVVTEDGQVPLTVFHFKAAGDSLPLGISSETFSWILVAVLIITSVVLLVILSHYWSFVRSLMRDEGYYLDERTRFDQNPQKYTVPNTLPKTVD